MKSWLLRVMVVVCAVAGGAASAQRSASVAEQYLFKAANAERAQRGLPTLRWDEALFRAAAMHAKVMAEHASISHQFAGEAELSARGRQNDVRFGVIAENVAEAQTAVQIHDAWMRSEHHRDNLLDPRMDAMAISVVRRDGQLYAVEDFTRSVATLSLEEQEQAIAKLVQADATVEMQPDATAARRACGQGSGMGGGYSGGRQPGFIMRFTTTNLDQLPAALKSRLATGRYHAASVGACNATGDQNFSTYSIAVLLY